MRALAPLVASLVVLTAGKAAHAGAPRPDRPMLTKTGDLVGGVEAEAGGLWQAEGFAAPLRMKVGAGWLEPRVSTNLAGLGSGSPGLVAGLKLGAIREDALGLAGYVESAVPVTSSESWSSELGGALTVRTDGGLELRANLGVAMAGSGGQVELVGAPARGLVGIPLGKRFSTFAEVEALLGATLPAWSLATGLGWRPAESLVVDAGLGWDLDVDAPILQLGMTLNAGARN